MCDACCVLCDACCVARDVWRVILDALYVTREVLPQVKSMNFEAWAHSFFVAVRSKHPELFRSSFDGLEQSISSRTKQMLLLP